MRRYEIRQVVVERKELVEERCDDCGFSVVDVGPLVEVVIDVHLGEEGGGRDEAHYCDDCLVKRAPVLVAAGSRAELVTGVPVEVDGDD